MAVDIARIAFAQREYRTAPPREDLGVQTRHPLAMELEYNSLAQNATDAQLLGNQILGLRKFDRWNWACFVKKSNYPVFEVGKTVTIFYPRFGFNNGADFIVKRVHTDSNALFDELTLFGPRGTTYEDAALATDFVQRAYWKNGLFYPTISDLSGFTYSGTGVTGYIDTDGTVHWFGNNVLCIDGFGYRSSQALTNEMEWSQDFTIGGGKWANDGSSVVTNNSILAPDGTLTGAKVADANQGTNGGVYIYDNGMTFSSGGKKTLSVFLKAGTNIPWARVDASNYSLTGLGAVTASVYFDLVNGIVGTASNCSGKCKLLPSGWIIALIEIDLDGTDLVGNVTIRAAKADGDFSVPRNGTSFFYVWQAQSLNEDGLDPQLIPLIATSGASASIGGTDLELAASLPAGDFIAFITFNQFPKQEAQLFTYSTAGVGTDNERLLARDQAGTNMEFQPRSGGLDLNGPSVIGSAFDVGRQVALIGRRSSKYISAVRKVDGTIIIRDDAPGTGVVPAITTLDIGSFRSGTSQISGTVERFVQYNGTFTDAQITAKLNAAVGL